jgi:hypothetical protein
VEGEEIVQFLKNIGAGDQLTGDELEQVRNEMQLKNPAPVEDLKAFLMKLLVSDTKE